METSLSCRRAGLAALLVASCCACAQGGRPAAPGDPGMVTRPPNVDSRSLEQPPRNVDPGIAAQPPASAASAARANRNPLPRRGEAREDDCRGPAELCKQDSAR